MSQKSASTTVSYKADVGANPMGAKGQNITKTPTVLIFKEGKEVHRVEEPSESKMGPVVATLSG